MGYNILIQEAKEMLTSKSRQAPFSPQSTGSGCPVYGSVLTSVSAGRPHTQIEEAQR